MVYFCLIIVAAIAGGFLLFFLVGCEKPDDKPKPKPLIPIPGWVTSPVYLHHYVTKYLPTGVGDDEKIYGYVNYYTTPGEFFSKEIPNAPEQRYQNAFPGKMAKPGDENTILTGGPLKGDCDNYAVFNGYISHEALKHPSYYVKLQTSEGGQSRAHAVAYGIDSEGVWVYNVRNLPVFAKSFEE
jgi:hypothetical protein